MYGYPSQQLKGELRTRMCSAKLYGCSLEDLGPFTYRGHALGRETTLCVEEELDVQSGALTAVRQRSTYF